MGTVSFPIEINSGIGRFNTGWIVLHNKSHTSSKLITKHCLVYTEKDCEITANPKLSTACTANLSTVHIKKAVDWKSLNLQMFPRHLPAVGAVMLQCDP